MANPWYSRKGIILFLSSIVVICGTGAFFFAYNDILISPIQSPLFGMSMLPPARYLNLVLCCCMLSGILMLIERGDGRLIRFVAIVMLFDRALAFLGFIGHLVDPGLGVMDVERSNFFFTISFLLLVFWSVLSWVLFKGTKNKRGKAGSRVWGWVIDIIVSIILCICAGPIFSYVFAMWMIFVMPLELLGILFYYLLFLAIYYFFFKRVLATSPGEVLLTSAG